MSLARTAIKAATKIPWKDIRAGATLLWDFYDRWRKSRAKAHGDQPPNSRSHANDPVAITKRLDQLEDDVATTMQALRADLEQFSKRHDELTAAAQIVSARVVVALAIGGTALALALALLIWLLLR